MFAITVVGLYFGPVVDDRPIHWRRKNRVSDDVVEDALDGGRRIEGVGVACARPHLLAGIADEPVLLIEIADVSRIQRGPRGSTEVRVCLALITGARHLLFARMKKAAQCENTATANTLTMEVIERARLNDIEY